MKERIMEELQDCTYVGDIVMLPINSEEKYMIHVERIDGDDLAKCYADNQLKRFKYQTVIMKYKEDADEMYYEYVMECSQHLEHAYSLNLEDVAEYIVDYIVRREM